MNDEDAENHPSEARRALAISAQGSRPSISAEDEAALTDLYVRGTPANTLRAYERDLLYIGAWRMARYGAGPIWPEREEVALSFVLDHSRDLAQDPPEGTARRIAEALIGAGLRKALACPSPATLDRRIASWRAFHRMRNLASPFEAPLIRQARAKARRAAARPPARKSANPLTREILRTLLATCGPNLRDLRDRAILGLGFASGGRRRSEIAGLRCEDLDWRDLEKTGAVRMRLMATKTTQTGAAPALILKGRAAPRSTLLARARKDRKRIRVSPHLEVRTGAGPRPLAGRRGPDREAPADPRRVSGGVRLRPRAALGFSHRGHAARSADPGGDAALAAPLHRPGAAVLR